MARQELLGAPWSIALDVEGGPVAVLPMRLNVDALNDLVVLNSGQSEPAVALTQPIVTFTVNSTADEFDATLSDGACDIDRRTAGDQCTLRAAIEQANASQGSYEIRFDLGSGTPTISLACALPAIKQAITIRGNTGDGTRVELDGSNAGVGVNGLHIETSLSVVSGMVINRFKKRPDGFINGIGIVLDGDHNIVEGNYLGTDADGTSAAGNEGAGILITAGKSGNWIGGDNSEARNVISGNGAGEQGSGHGIEIGNPAGGAVSNDVLGNYIGTDASGSEALGNAGVGVLVVRESSDNWIGGITADERNLISGNGSAGVVLQDANTTDNRVLGNYIGTAANGKDRLGNTEDGVRIINASQNSIGGQGGVTPGGSCTGACNIISGNDGQGVVITGTTATTNTVLGNYIGTDVEGTGRDLGNSLAGVYILGGARDNMIGGATEGARNLISGNHEAGVELRGTETMSNTVQGNYIGTNAAGTDRLGNGWAGVVIRGDAKNNTIGGDTEKARNLISGNDEAGVLLQGTETMSNTVQGNYIGTNAAGTDRLGNGGANDGAGVFIRGGAKNNTIGGDTEKARNLISGNDAVGVLLQGAETISNTVQGNYIGTNAAGTDRLGNVGAGVYIRDGAKNNTIGGRNTENVHKGNLISDNWEGVLLEGAETMSNTVQGNYIGTNAAGTRDLGNSGEGVVIVDDAKSNMIGGATEGAGNLISGNDADGVELQGAETMSNTVQGNYIGTDADGTRDLGNSGEGVFIRGGAKNNTIGGDTEAARNLISGNDEDGVLLRGTETMSNTVQGNYIGTDADGTRDLGNSGAGVFIGGSARNNTIGGATPGARNLISGNDEDGVRLEGAETKAIRCRATTSALIGRAR